ncbi:hypothetical protein ABIF66_008853 [Bradyrhizobium japonicum]|uniref:hypothetical protein n=1 Tax=Bradyrhizobium liaoningense TaxID=43992 RepID=UPI001BAA752D|nr:hypothetical protein [Bradyrhizobium liaoningense]MBR1070231.1 hypothetical protein [Bradyrhizobium liaoningense]
MNTQPPAMRALAKRNLLMAALDAAYARCLIVTDDTHRPFEFQIVGMPALGCIRSDDHEIFVTAIVAPTALARRRFACCALSGHRRPLFGEATATGWLDRGKGRFFEISGGYHASNAATPLLAGMTFTKERSAPVRRSEAAYVVAHS